MASVTEILSQIEQGDSELATQLLPLAYDELRKLAAHRLAGEKPGQTLQDTALVHEAYLRTVDADRAKHWDSRGHFFAAAAESMRRILVDQARRKARPKHAGDRRRVELAEVPSGEPPSPIDTLAINEVLQQSESIEPDIQEISTMDGISIGTGPWILGMGSLIMLISGITEVAAPSRNAAKKQRSRTAP